jgi:hypothetical protein
MDQTEILIRNMDGGAFQQLAFDLIPKIRPDIISPVHSGAVEGTSKTRKGTPDIWGKTRDGSIVYVSVTANPQSGKMFDDVKKSITQLQELGLEKGALCIAFLSFEPQHKEFVECEKYCEKYGCRFEVITNSKISSILNTPPNHGLRFKHLGLQPSTMFISLDDFQESIVRRNKNLKFSVKFAGRDLDLDRLVEEATSDKMVLILYGSPGVGKTRLTVELVKRLLIEEKFSDHIPVVLNNDNLNVGLGLLDLDASKRYILVVDDANQVDDLGIIKGLIIDWTRKDGSIIIMNVRNYGLDKIQSEIDTWRLDSVTSYPVGELGNKDIDELLKDEPFNIKSSDFRERIIMSAKGNLRLASMLAEVAKQVGVQKVLQPFEVYEQYYKSVFSELEMALERSYEEKMLLVLISALKSINLNDKSLVLKIVDICKFKDENHLEYTLGELDKYEIIDRSPSGIVKIFNDSISEYVFYRYCFGDRIVANFQIVLDNFMDGYADKILENLALLVSKGYKSERLDDALTTLLIMAKKALIDEPNQRDGLAQLQWMSVYAGARPDECLAIITNFWQKKKEYISTRESKFVASILKRIYYRSWNNNFEPLVETLWEIANSDRENHQEGRQEAIKFFSTSFKYLPPYETKEGEYQLVYLPQSFILSKIDKWLKGDVADDGIKLIVKMLAQVCANQIFNDYMSPIDENTLVMQSGTLTLTPDLVKIRKTAFNQLLQIYMEQTGIDIRLEILNALRSPFEPLQLGGVPSQKLIEFDSELIVSVLNEISQTEENLLLKNKLLGILDVIEENDLIEKYHRSFDLSKIRTNIRTDELTSFQMLGWSYWHKKIGDLDDLQSAQSGYLRMCAAKFTLKNYKDMYNLMKVWDSWYKLDGQVSTLICGILTKVGRLSPDIGALLIENIEKDAEYFNPEHAGAILMGIGWRNMALEKEICADWARKKDVGKCRVAASALGVGRRPLSVFDKPLIDELVGLGDDTIDRIMVNVLVAYTAMDNQWVIDKLLSISSRCTEETYNNLLMYLEPRSGGYFYNIYDTRYEMFKKLVFGTIRFASLDRLSFNIGKCLKLLGDKEGISVICDYLKERVDQKSNDTSHLYKLLPESLGERNDFSFISQIKDYDRLFGYFITIAAGSTIRDHIFDMLSTTIGSFNDPAILPVLDRWIDDEGTLIDLLSRLPITDIWYESVDKIVQVTHNSAQLSKLHEAFEGRGVHWGSVPEHYQKIISQLESKKALFTNNPKMLAFLNGAQDFYRQKAKKYERIIWSS